MAATLKRATAIVASTRTLALTATTGVQTIVIGGTISNNDATGVYHSLTAEIQLADLSYVALVTNTPIAVGGALNLPKFVINAGEKLYLTADVSSQLTAYISYVEKS